ncbi:LytR/AlgR family response regulator transcription factor [Acidobacteriota bacterium]
MLRCIIVDDENGAVEILTRYVQRNQEIELVRSFRDSIEALTFMADHDLDIVFMDIDMPNLNGMHLSELIRSKNIQVIFCTAYSEYAVESYEKNAVDYLLKPIAYERFCKAVEKAQKARFGLFEQDRTINPEKSENAGKIFIKSGPRIHQLDISELLYMEKKGHYVVFHMPGGQRLSRMNMRDLMSTLPRDDFVRIHRSFVVAIDKIDTIEKQMVIINKRKIPIGESYQEDFFNRIKFSGS